MKEKQVKYEEIKISKKKYIVEINEQDNCTEFWLYNKSYGVKLQMFSLSSVNLSEKEILRYINNNILDYVKEYQEQFEDIEEEE